MKTVQITMMSDHEQSPATRYELARVIWETSRLDEGTISATGANIVADVILAKFTMTQKEKTS